MSLQIKTQLKERMGMKVILIGFAFFLGIGFGMWVSQRDLNSQIITTYEDGSFVGCYKKDVCNEYTP